MTRDYYKPSEVWRSYSIDVLMWIIPFLHLLRSGQYPPEPATGYVGFGQKQIKATAPFIKASDIYAEITDRLERCGKYGMFTWLVYSVDKEDRLVMMQHIATSEGVDINEVERRTTSVLHYIRGKGRKQTTFNDWKNHKKGGKR